MAISRRGFLTAMLAAGAAPAIVKADSLMKIVVPSKKIVLVHSLVRLAGDFDGDTWPNTDDLSFGEVFFPTIVVHPQEIVVVDRAFKPIKRTLITRR